MALCAVAALSLTAACGGGGSDDKGGEGGASQADKSTVKLPKLKGEKLQVAAVWTGDEGKNFTKVIEAFEKRTGAEVEVTPTGDNVATFLGSKIEGGAPPDVAMLPQVGVLNQFAEKGWLKPLDDATKEQLGKNFSKGWQDLGANNGKQYGVYFKAASKSLIWYNAGAYEAAGVSEAKTWKEFVKNAQTISDSGVEPVSVGGADGWVLTDWFENIYLSQAGPEKYDKLAKHEIKWTDPSVKKALTTLAELFGKKELLAGGNKGALQTDFPKSVTQTFDSTDTPSAASVFEGDFVGINVANDTKAKIGKDAKVYPFPTVDGKAPVVTGGDAAVALKDNKGAHALLTFLASPEAAAVWAQEGGFVSPNKNLDAKAYPDDVQREIAKALVSAGDDFRFDMSDQAPAEFGGTKGKGEWKALQDFLKNPKDVAGTQSALEAAASKAYKD
ncbi:sugar ABC transporter substrate-binding protein [Streptomyces abyssalis]|uniref:Sugar ABC transporter substrate-binding protein n=1 Tax=Streptomyces abyssalis TaxID=933944 RepID=A0A1E7JJA0_9ACTN|nr:sugar ABC transporter substrate-binding protein [Streptomyces abyssalis]OEU87699.1 sugar ABC transporter substrate-binding protein [Streptomyces abyssalis]OEV30019.1 sugar ABC transporter substrate-binding protein [Streptomyces nanshensis]